MEKTNSRSKTPYSPEENATLLELFALGKTALQISEVLGRSRNSVLGRIDRIRDAEAKKNSNLVVAQKMRHRIPYLAKKPDYE